MKAVAWVCSNPVHGQFGVSLAFQPKFPCSCGRKFKKISTAAAKCTNCGLHIHYWVAGAPCQLCGREVQPVAQKVRAA